MTADFDFAILGAGAIGSILAAHLTRAGYSVGVLARGRRAADIQENGLRICGLAEMSTPARVLTEPIRLRRCRALIVATKAIDTARSLAALSHVRMESALSLQNGTTKNDLLAAAFGTECLLGALADTSGELLKSGEVLFTRNVNILIGEPNGQTSDRALQIAAAIDTAGVRATTVVNIVSLEWSKFLAWCPLVLLSLTTRSPTGNFLRDTQAARAIVRVVRELAQLPEALGIELTDKTIIPVASLCVGPEQDATQRLVTVGRQFASAAPAHRMSSLQDLEVGRPLELDETLGSALTRAQQLGLRLPLVTDLYYQAQMIAHRASSPPPTIEP